jgi:hypothetical protein
LGFLGDSLGGVLGFTKTVAFGITGAVAGIGVKAVYAIFGPTIGGMFEGLVNVTSAILKWIVNGFSFTTILGRKKCQ